MIGLYILQSLKNNRYYIGSTVNIDQRLAEHNQGRVRATKFISPLKLKVFIPCTSVEEARSSEYRLKKYKSKAIIEKVVSDGIFPWNHKGL